MTVPYTVLHTGHIRFVSSHFCMHPAWKKCPTNRMQNVQACAFAQRLRLIMFDVPFWYGYLETLSQGLQKTNQNQLHTYMYMGAQLLIRDPLVFMMRSQHGATTVNA